MSDEMTTGSNPEQTAAEDAVFGSSDSFFDAIEDNVNGMVSEEKSETTAEETPQQVDPNSAKVEPQVPNKAFQKRYRDSSREAQRLKAQLDELKPFVPVLDAMKKDSGLVDHVRGYFQKGGAVPNNVKDELKLGEDFMFDTDEMVSNPDSDSRKVFNAMVDKVVNKRATQILEREKKENVAYSRKQRTRELAQDFMKRSGMGEDEFADFVLAARDRFKSEPLSFDDMYMLMNQHNVNKNVANATKEDMLSQMKNVREMPTSQSGSNNAGDGKANPNDSLFDTLLDVDGNLDNMFD